MNILKGMLNHALYFISGYKIGIGFLRNVENV